MASKWKTYIDSPIGNLEIEGSQQGIEGIRLIEHKDVLNLDQNPTIPEVLTDCASQLHEYFDGRRTQFEIKFNVKGTPFQRKVWNELLNIPYGKTMSYRDQAKKLGNLKAIRAIASANGKNPFLIVVPCHRVLGSDGSLTGYAGGLWRKKWLLNHEQSCKQQSLF